MLYSSRDRLLPQGKCMQNWNSIAKDDTLSARHIKTSNSQRKQTSYPYLHIYLDNIYYLGKHIAHRPDKEKNK